MAFDRLFRVIFYISLGFFAAVLFANGVKTNRAVKAANSVLLVESKDGLFDKNDSIRNKNSDIEVINLVSANNITTQKNVVNIKDLGAKGDGITDDSGIISAALNSGAKVVIFPKAEYACNKHIRMETSNVKIIGNGSTLVTNDNFSADYKEWFFLVKAKNIEIDELNFECRETNKHKFKTQLGIAYSRGVKITNCRFYIPHTVIEKNPFKTIEYSNFDIYTGCHDVVVDKCTMIDYADAYAGLCCQIRDFAGVGSSNISFTNNKCYHMGRDEILAVFSNTNSRDSVNTLSDVTISGNTFVQSVGNYTRNAGMTLSAANNRGVYNLRFINNYVEIQANCMFFITGDAHDMVISGNTMKLTVEDDTDNMYIFWAQNNHDLVDVNENSITIEAKSDGGSGNFKISNNPMNLYSNTISIK